LPAPAGVAEETRRQVLYVYFVLPGEEPCCDIVIDWSTITEACELMPQTLLTTGVFIQWLRQHFTDAENITHAQLQDNLWTNDVETTKILIGDVWNWKPDDTGRRPAVLVRRGKWQLIARGIDNRKMVSVNRGNNCCDNRVEEHIAMLEGSHVFFCISNHPGAVELLADEVAKELLQFAPKARKYFNFLRLNLSEHGEPSVLEESEQHFVVPLVMTYGAQYVWRLCPESLT